MTDPVLGITYLWDHAGLKWRAPGRDPLGVGGSTPKAGALPLGDATYPVPAGAVFVSTTGSDSGGNGTQSAPYATLARAVAAASPGATVVIRGGEYRQRVGDIAKPLTIQNYPGEEVWFDGSDVVTGWVANGNGTWTAPFVQAWDHSASFTQGSNAGGFVDTANYPYAAWPDTVFIDGERQRQVASSPKAGQFSVTTSSLTATTHTTTSVTIGTDPTGRQVRLGRRDIMAVVKAACTIRGIGVRRYSTSLWMFGAINIVQAGAGTLLENLWVMDMATSALSANGAGTRVEGCSVIRSGYLGINGNNGVNVVLARNWIDESNWEMFNHAPAASAIKVARMRNVTIRDNVLSNSRRCGGIWLDESCWQGAIINNLIEDCAEYLVLIEASGALVVAGNRAIGATGCKYGITGLDADQLKIWNNYVDNCSSWQIGLSQDFRRNQGNPSLPYYSAFYPDLLWINREEEVCNNVFGGTHALFQFYALDKDTGIPAQDMMSLVAGNVFSSRVGVAPPESNRMIGWGDSSIPANAVIYKTPAAFQAAWPSKGRANSLTSAQAPTQADLAAYGPLAEPLSSPVAAALGLPPGTQVAGPPIPAPVRTSLTP